MTCVSLIFFFFSSRRRHTRFSRDWSSDVCSSDLPASSFGNGRPRIVGIGGTTRANSSSEQALRAVLTRLERAGAQCDAYCADNIKFPMYDPQDETRCEAALHLLESVRAADAVIVSTPGYHGGLSGMLKNALDYLQDLADDDVPYL